MTDFRTKAEAVRRERRQRGPWSVEDERKWLEEHPEDQGTPSFLTGGPLPKEPEPAHDDDVIPEIDSGYTRTDDDDAIDRLIEGIGIVEAYNRWCGKSTPKPGRRREGIKVSCPNPAHPDRNPSAWLNTDKDVWTCGACGIGGDVLDIAAWNFGYPVPGYKQGKTFVELRERIAADYGYFVSKTPTGSTYLQPVEDESPEEETDESEPEQSTPIATVTPIPLPSEEDEDYYDDKFSMEVPWEQILRDPTYMRALMVEAANTDIPEEYFFWNGLQVLGLVVGDNVILNDNPPVKANLFCCLTGRTGDGKTRSISTARRLLAEVAPFDPDTGNGVYLVPEPGSAEALIDSFALPIYDPNDPANVIGHAGVKGFVRIDELSGLVGRASRMGNPLKPTLMQFFDSYGPVELRSRATGVVRAVDHFASCVTSTQPRAIRSVVQETDVDSGFVNRWLFCVGRRKERYSYGGSTFDITAPAELLKKIRAWGATKRELNLTGDALAVWDNFFHQELYPAILRDESSLTVRCDLLLKKIILLFCIDRKLNNPGVQEVRDAILLWPYLQYTYSILQGQIGVGPFEECRASVEDVVIRFTQKNGRPPTQRDINRWLAKRKYPLDLLNKVISEMTKIGQLRETMQQSTKVGGRPAIRYEWID